MATLDQMMKVATLTGHGFSLSERTAIQAASTLLLMETKQQRVKVWGKVLGHKTDYIIVMCIGQSALSTCLTFFSLDGGISYALLQPFDESDSARTRAVSSLRGHYVGDPSYEYRVPDPSKEPGSVITVKESERLAYFIAQHDTHCRVIPRGSQLLHEDGSIRLNALFDGLDRSAAGKLGSYVHLRNQRRPATLLEQEGINKAVDFLDPLTDDIPAGVWSLKYDPFMDVVYGSSNLFVGGVFYHQPETSMYGNIYVGDGCPNHDCAFML